jgi:tRNA threonylcarbamoyl adenosine modification protein (Sua5/YciO/YrdC/YwlC family)
MLLKIYEDNPSSRHIKQAADTLREGGIIIYPTDTIYALGCDLYNLKAIDKLAMLKGLRREEARFSFICHDLSQLSDYTKPISNDLFRLMRQLLPGPYTFILDANNNVPKIVQRKRKQVGIRVPDNSITRAIVEMLGNPIMSTSIHDTDEIIEYTTDPELIYEKFRDQVDLVIDGGYGGNQPSTVLDCTGGEIVVTRAGKGPVEDIMQK